MTVKSVLAFLRTTGRIIIRSRDKVDGKFPLKLHHPFFKRFTLLYQDSLRSLSVSSWPVVFRMRTSTCAVLALVCLLVLVSTPDESSAFIGKVLHKFEKNVLRKVAKPVNKVFGKVVEKPVKSVLKAVGLKKVRKTYKEFKHEVVHSRVTFTAASYRVEKITPCANGQHDIVTAEQPVEIHFADGVMVIQDRYCRKCGQHFFSGGGPRDEL